jgi:hypothetical protein
MPFRKSAVESTVLLLIVGFLAAKRAAGSEGVLPLSK